MGESVRRSAVALLVAAGLTSGAANAVLIDQGDGTVLDTTTNLEWVKDGSLGGLRTWQDAKDWASGSHPGRTELTPRIDFTFAPRTPRFPV
jgi:predicted porin